MIAEHAYEYEVGQRAEVKECGAWLPVTIAGRFVGLESGWPVYIIAGASDRDRYRYGCDLRPVTHAHVWGKWTHAGPLLLAYDKRYCACGAFQTRRVSS